MVLTLRTDFFFFKRIEYREPKINLSFYGDTIYILFNLILVLLAPEKQLGYSTDLNNKLLQGFLA